MSTEKHRLNADGDRMKTTTTLADGYLSEMRDRMRRIETKLTKFMDGTLVGPAGSKPEMIKGELHIPSMECTFSEIISVVPPMADVRILHKGEQVGWVENTLRVKT